MICAYIEHYTMVGTETLTVLTVWRGLSKEDFHMRSYYKCVREWTGDDNKKRVQVSVFVDGKLKQAKGSIGL